MKWAELSLVVSGSQKLNPAVSLSAHEEDRPVKTISILPGKNRVPIELPSRTFAVQATGGLRGWGRILRSILPLPFSARRSRKSSGGPLPSGYAETNQVKDLVTMSGAPWGPNLFSLSRPDYEQAAKLDFLRTANRSFRMKTLKTGIRYSVCVSSRTGCKTGHVC